MLVPRNYGNILVKSVFILNGSKDMVCCKHVQLSGPPCMNTFIQQMHFKLFAFSLNCHICCFRFSALLICSYSVVKINAFYNY